MAVSRSHNQLSISIPLPYTITPLPAPRSWKEHIKTRPQTKQHFLTKVKIPNPLALTAAIATPLRTPILVVSDGSFKSPYGAFSWEIEQNQTTLATCTGPVGGSPVTTFRTECYAILTWTTFLIEYISYTNSVISMTVTNKTPHGTRPAHGGVANGGVPNHIITAISFKQLKAFREWIK